MTPKPIFVATHPRACSTAFERVFMTRRDELNCIHEPFGDAFYFGPERLSVRYDGNEEEIEKSGFKNSTYQMVLDKIEAASNEGRRVFIKDIVHYLVPPNRAPASIAPSVAGDEQGISKREASEKTAAQESTSEPKNPTVLPASTLEKFHFTFLIRHPRSSIPSYYRCTISPLDQITGFYHFMPSEAGYDEVRRVFDYLRAVGLIGPTIAGKGQHDASDKGKTNGVEICVVDADDMLENPAGIIKAYCHSVGVPYDSKMLSWDNAEDHNHARTAFAKWSGFHEDAIGSSSLKPRAHREPKSTDEEDTEWRAKYGEQAARVIRETVNKNIEDYEYMKQFAIKV